MQSKTVITIEHVMAWMGYLHLLNNASHFIFCSVQYVDLHLKILELYRCELYKRNVGIYHSFQETNDTLFLLLVIVNSIVCGK